MPPANLSSSPDGDTALDGGHLGVAAGVGHEVEPSSDALGSNFNRLLKGWPMLHGVTVSLVVSEPGLAPTSPRRRGSAKLSGGRGEQGRLDSGACGANRALSAPSARWGGPSEAALRGTWSWRDYFAGFFAAGRGFAGFLAAAG